MFKRAIIAFSFATTALWCCSADAWADDVATWPAGCVAPHSDYGQLRFEFDLTDVSHIDGIDVSLLAKQLAAMRVPSWWAEGPSPTAYSEPSFDRAADRAIIVVTEFPLAANPNVDRLAPSGGGVSLGIVRGDLSRMLTNDGGVIVLRVAGPLDDMVSEARREATCITQLVSKVGTVQCGMERLAANPGRIRELWVVGLEPIVDIMDDKHIRPVLVASQDYLAHAIQHCLDYLTGPHL